MNFGSRFSTIEQKQKELEKLIENLSVAYNEARDFTESFLKCCEKHNVKTVSIGTPTKLIKSCKDWPFDFGNSVFADGIEDGWPTIWAVTEETGIGGPCGNHGQHSVSTRAQAKLVDGVYRLKRGKWIRLNDDEV